MKTVIDKLMTERRQLKENMRSKGVTAENYEKMNKQQDDIKKNINKIAGSSLSQLYNVYYVKNPENNTAFAVDEHQLDKYKKLGYVVISKEDAHELMFKD